MLVTVCGLVFMRQASRARYSPENARKAATSYLAASDGAVGRLLYCAVSSKIERSASKGLSRFSRRVLAPCLRRVIVLTSGEQPRREVNMTTTIPAALAAALVKAQADFRPAPKDNANPAFRSRYADLATIVETVRPVLAKHALGFIQPVTSNEDGSITVTTVLVHSSGETLASPGVTVRPAKGDAQAVGSAITYARRYDLSSLLGIVADDDDDGNAAVGGRPTPKPAPRPEPKAAAIDLEKAKAWFESAGLALVDVEREVEKVAADWSEADRPAIKAAVERLRGGA
jgi:hypothetical protein